MSLSLQYHSKLPGGRTTRSHRRVYLLRGQVFSVASGEWSMRRTPRLLLTPVLSASMQDYASRYAG